MLEKALEQALKQGSDNLLSTVSNFLQEHNVRSLIVAVDDQHTEPYVASTITKMDMTVPMVQGFVFVMLEQAGVPNPAPQAAMAANFVNNFVKKNIK
jgi:hypothetical protein